MNYVKMSKGKIKLGGTGMSIEFFDVKERKKVKIEESSITKTKYERKLKDGSTQIRYAFRAKTSDGRNLTKFCSKSDWDKVSAKEA